MNGYGSIYNLAYAKIRIIRPLVVYRIMLKGYNYYSYNLLLQIVFFNLELSNGLNCNNQIQVSSFISCMNGSQMESKERSLPQNRCLH